MNNLKVIFSLIILSQISLDAPQKKDEELPSILRQIEIRERADIEAKNRTSNSPQQPIGSNQCAFYSFANALESIRARKENRIFDKNLSESLAMFLRNLALNFDDKYKAEPKSLFEVYSIPGLLNISGNINIKQEYDKSNISLMSRSEMPFFNALCTWAPKEAGSIIFLDESRHHFICLDIDPSRRGNEIIVRDSMERSNSSTQHYTDLINEIKQRFNLLPARRHSPGRPSMAQPIRPPSPIYRIPYPSSSRTTSQALPVSLSDNKERILSPGRRIVSTKQQQDAALARRRQQQQQQQQQQDAALARRLAQQEQDAAIARRLAQQEQDAAIERRNKQAKENRDLIECRMCTFENPLTNRRCEICESVLIN